MGSGPCQKKRIEIWIYRKTLDKKNCDIGPLRSISMQQEI
jgi:hypothetical protein